MEIYTSDTSYIIRQDFMRFSTDDRTRKQRQKLADKKRYTASLERLRERMSNDDGLGSFGSYKCPIF